MSEATLRLTGYAYGGEALGRLDDGRMVFVPFALPGETVRVRLVEGKRGYARGQLLEVLVASPERTQPLLRPFRSLWRLPLPAPVLPFAAAGEVDHSARTTGKDWRPR